MVRRRGRLLERFNGSGLGPRESLIGYTVGYLLGAVAAAGIIGGALIVIPPLLA